MSAKQGYEVPSVTQYGTVSELTETTEKCGSSIDAEDNGVSQGDIVPDEECEVV